MSLCKKPIETQLLPPLSNPQDPQRISAGRMTEQWITIIIIITRADFKTTPPIETFIIHRVWKYVGKPFSLNENQYQKEMLSTWIHTSLQQNWDNHWYAADTCSSAPSKMLFLLFTKMWSSVNRHQLQEANLKKLFDEMITVTKTATTTKYLQPKFILTYETTY